MFHLVLLIPSLVIGMAIKCKLSVDVLHLFNGRMVPLLVPCRRGFLDGGTSPEFGGREISQ